MNARKTACTKSLFLAAMLFALGCGDVAKTTKEKDQVYDIKGRVTKVSAEKNAVTIDHSDIPGLMKAMEMKFPVESGKVLEGIQPGDQVHGRLKAKDGDYVITELHKS